MPGRHFPAPSVTATIAGMTAARIADLRHAWPDAGDAPLAGELAREAQAGRLDADAVTTIVEAAGQRAPRLERPAGLTEREAEVIAMPARGLQTKQVARALVISVKTADRNTRTSRRFDPCRGDAVRHGARAHRVRRTPDGQPGGSVIASAATRELAAQRRAEEGGKAGLPQEAAGNPETSSSPLI
jgi:hypothetical protein